MNFLGIDVGTGGSRAVLINQNGAVIASATVEHAPFASPQTGWAEQHPADWQRAATAAIRAVTAGENVDPAAISAVGLTGQMHGSVLLDERDEVLRPALLWCDQRTESQCQQITAQIGKEKFIELASNPAITGFTLPKLLWVRENEPDIWQRVKTVLLPKDYIRLQLTGDKATDVADASGTLLLDVAGRDWSGEMLAAAEINSSLLPRVFESSEITGTISKAGAAATGLKIGTPVVAGAGDNAAGAIGMGIVKPGAVSVTIGTSGVVFAVTERPMLDPRGRIHTLCHAIPNRWHNTGVTLAAGLSLRWFRDNFGDSQNYDALVSEAAAVADGANGLLWLPYLMGERTPHLDANARAAFVGITASHTRAHFVRAVLEGVAFSLRDALEIFRELKVRVDSIKLGGGGARSVIWNQIQADTYGQIVQTIAADEGAAFGAALLAAVGAGAFESVDAACEQTIRTAEQFEPESAAVDKLNRNYRAYQLLYAALRPALGILNAETGVK